MSTTAPEPQDAEQDAQQAVDEAGQAADDAAQAEQQADTNGPLDPATGKPRGAQPHEA